MTTATHTLEFALDLPAPPARVFAALTEARHLVHWFCDAAESETRPGGYLMMAWSKPCSSPEPYQAEWVAFDPPSHAAHAGGHAGYPGGYSGRIDLMLAPRDAGTRLVVRHVFPPAREYERFVETYHLSWPKALARLEAYLTPQDPAPTS